VNPDDARTTGVMIPEQAPEQAGVPQRQQLSFRTSGLVIDLELTGSGASRRLTGQLIPGQSGVVEIRGVITVEADAGGRFSIDAVPPGQVSLRCRLGAGSDRGGIATGWVAI
jgi:hypothetical protein